MLSRHSVSVVPVILITAGTLVVGCAGGMVDPGIRSTDWPVGTTATYVTVSEQVATAATPMGEMSSTTTESMTITVGAVGPDLFELTITETGLETDAPNQGNEETRDIHSLIGLKSLVRLDNRGLIIDATNLENTAAVARNGGPKVITEDFQRCFLYLPEKQLKPGVEWTREYAYPQGETDFILNVDQVDSYQCVEQTDVDGIPAYMIAVSSRMDWAGGDPKGVRSMSLSGHGQGQLLVARDSGMLLSQESAVVLQGRLWAMEREIPVSMTIATTVRRAPLPAATRRILDRADISPKNRY